MFRFALLALLSLQLGAQALRIDGGAAPMENIFKPVRAAFEARAGLRLELQENGPEVALLALDKGEVDAAAAGLSPASWFELMASRGHKGIRQEAFVARRIGFDKINVFLHGDLVLFELDKAQLKALFTGKATNWKDVGGPDLKVVVILGEKMPGTNKIFQEQVMDGAAYASAVRWSGSTPEVIQALAATPGSIGLGPLSALKAEKLTSPSTPEVGRPITLLTKGAPGPGLAKLLAFVEGEGKALTSR
ncbi:substrate-binding domain-containing protein [Geothrix sp. 21YS21S-2]|uniref:substrate-binding domain-containing protein n=1 Tax=Geothrix sp. 21YS21S-2 TaxID=3068893 RepID=UPI0027B8915E|nr:substrate-binding domain-containing protein [Geothrix sp. 21YS21S-2]